MDNHSLPLEDTTEDRCCQMVEAEIALDMSGENAKLPKASDLGPYQQGFFARMGAAIGVLKREFGNVIVEEYPGLGTVSAMGSPQDIERVRESANGKILRFRHCGPIGRLHGRLDQPETETVSLGV